MGNYTPALTGAQIDAALVAAPSTQLNYNQTVPSVTSSLNVSSVTDSSAGDFTVNYTTLYAVSTYFVAKGTGDSAVPSEHVKVLNTNTRTAGALNCAGGFMGGNFQGVGDNNSNMVEVSGEFA